MTQQNSLHFYSASMPVGKQFITADALNLERRFVYTDSKLWEQLRKVCIRTKRLTRYYPTYFNRCTKRNSEGTIDSLQNHFKAPSSHLKIIPMGRATITAKVAQSGLKQVRALMQNKYHCTLTMETKKISQIV